MSTVCIFQQQKIGIIVKMILLLHVLGGAHYVHEFNKVKFVQHVRVSLLRVQYGVPNVSKALTK